MRSTVLLLFLLAMHIQLANSHDPETNNKPNKALYKGLTEEDFAAALLVENEMKDTAETVDAAIMYNMNRFQGDIVNPGLSAQNIRSFIGDESPTGEQGVLRNAARSQLLLWPNGRIPYTIRDDFTADERAVIAAAMADYHNYTCIRFVPKEQSDIDYVEIIKDRGCYSYLGRSGEVLSKLNYDRKQPLSLGEGCVHKGIAIHEMMHTVGFLHEQSRADRDEYVKINWQNMYPSISAWAQFAKLSLKYISHLGTPYDYDSVMHYPRNAGSINGRPTMEPLKEGVEIGNRRGFSPNDIIKINRLYGCDSSYATSTAPPFRRCHDKMPTCAALKKAGHCGFTFSKRFMEENCQLTCNLCRADGSARCENEESWCVPWAFVGYCTEPGLKKYMSERCPKACFMC